MYQNNANNTSEMSAGRGAFLVLEGCDRVGKSTQARMLIEALNKRNIPTVSRRFPDRTTPTGMLLDSFLSKKQDFPPEVAHLLFSANRWECQHEILKTLHSGITLVVDRYAASGAAYTAAATGKSLSWCKECDRGLPSPDMVVLLKLSKELQESRSHWGKERFETTEIQQGVASKFEELKDETWSTIDASQDPTKIHSQILQKVLDKIEKVKNIPVGRLYESTAEH